MVERVRPEQPKPNNPAPIPAILQDVRRGDGSNGWQDRVTASMAEEERLRQEDQQRDESGRRAADRYGIPQATVDGDAELIRDVEGNIRKLTAATRRPPLQEAAIAISDQRFHQLMATATGIVKAGGEDLKGIEPHKLAVAMSTWSLKERIKPTLDAGLPQMDADPKQPG